MDSLTSTTNMNDLVRHLGQVGSEIISLSHSNEMSNNW